MSDLTPMPDDLARDLAAELEWVVRLPQHPYPLLAAALRRALAAEAEVARLRALVGVNATQPPVVLAAELEAYEACARFADDVAAAYRTMYERYYDVRAFHLANLAEMAETTARAVAQDIRDGAAARPARPAAAPEET